jgi:hypothetical protein
LEGKCLPQAGAAEQELSLLEIAAAISTPTACYAGTSFQTACLRPSINLRFYKIFIILGEILVD